MQKRKTKEQFLEEIKNIHGNFYDYSAVEYSTGAFKVKIICPLHGEFEMLPGNLRNSKPKMACPRCRGIKLYSQRSFLLEACKAHNDKYDYSLVCYINSNKSVKIICKKHGVFEQSPLKHISGQGCKKCRDDSFSFNGDEILKMFKDTHGDRYDYSNVGEITRCTDKVKIICKIHGVFIQSVGKHKGGCGCPVCANGQVFRDTKMFIEESNKVHHNFYDYSKTDYKKLRNKVIVTCKVHGDFLIWPRKHLYGQGCPSCSQKNSKGEIEIDHWLLSRNFYYKKEFRFKDCKYKHTLPFDFAVFEDKEMIKIKCLIEFDGEGHYKVATWYGSNKNKFDEGKNRDEIKNSFCLQKNIRLLRIPYWQFKNIDSILENFVYNI